MNIWIILVILGFLGLVIVIADILQNGLSIGEHYWCISCDWHNDFWNTRNNRASKKLSY